MSEPASDLEAVEVLRRGREALLAELGKVVVGQRDVLELILTALFCEGHSLIVGVPGLAKTLLIQSLAQSLGLDFSRIQFTPDLMPADITGTDILEEDRASGPRIKRKLRWPLARSSSRMSVPVMSAGIRSGVN